MQDPFPWEQPKEEFGVPARLPHSRLGIASFIISLVAGSSLVAATFALMCLLFATAGGKVEGRPSPLMVFLGCWMLLAPVGALLGAALGIAGLVERGRRRVFAALGLVFNGLIVLGLVFLLIIGSLARA
jgi:hypothetical protein